MMQTETFTFDDFEDQFQLEASKDIIAQWPEMSVEFEYKFYPAEPEIGIFSRQLEINDTKYFFDNVSFGTDAEMAEAVYAHIESDIEEGENDVLREIRAQIARWEEELDERPAD
jgi:hypothetical protein